MKPRHPLAVLAALGREMVVHSVACPKCGAKREEWCSTPKGHRLEYLHNARFSAHSAMKTSRPKPTTEETP